MPKLLKPYRLLDYTTYTFYNQQGIPSKHKIKDRRLFLDVVKAVGDHIAQNIVERKGGVLIKGLGYFFVWKVPRKMTFDIKMCGGSKEEHYNYHTGHHMYSPIFMPHLGRNNLRGWSMDNKFCKNIRMGIKNKLLTGFRYKMYAYSIRIFNK